MPMVTAGRGSLAAEVYGPADGLPILLVAGGGGAMSSWLRLVPEVHPTVPNDLPPVAPITEPLTNDLRIAVFDQAGLGRSAQVAPATTIEEAARDAAAVGLALLGPRFAVAGLSLGGAVAIHIALLFPDAVTALVIGCAYGGLSGFVGPPPPDPSDQRVDRSISRRFLGEAASMVHTLDHIRDAVARHPDTDDASIHLFLSHDNPPLENIDAPTIVLCGTEDDIFPDANSALIAEHIPASQLVLVPGAGHALHLEAPDDLAVAIRSLLAPPRRGEGRTA